MDYLRGLRFRIEKSKHILRAKDIESLRMLQEIRNQRPSASTNCWLLSHRQRIRAIIRRKPRAALMLVACTAHDESIRALAIWLRGLSGGSLGSNALLQIGIEGSVNSQIAVARALNRMGAWAQLRQLEAHFLDSKRTEISQRKTSLRIAMKRRFKQKKSREFSVRLSDYLTKHQSKGKIESDEAFVHARQNIENLVALGADPAVHQGGESVYKVGKPAKPLWLIRLVLDRIRSRVSGQESFDRSPSLTHEKTPRI